MERAIKISAGLMGLSLLIALFSGLSYGLPGGLNSPNKSPVEERHRRKSFGMSGSVKGRVFTRASAAGYFNVGRSRTAIFNLENFSGGTYGLKVRGPGGVLRLNVPPGLTKLRVPAESGPFFLRFEWDRPPQGVIMTRLDTREYRRFFRAMAAAMLFAVLLLGLLLYRARVSPGPAVSLRSFRWTAWVFFIGLYFLVFHHASIPLTGDEPHYMMQSESMAMDGTLNIAGGHASRYHAIYFPTPVSHHGVSVGSEIRSVHYPLLSVLLLPAFAPGVQTNHYVLAKLIMLVCVAGIAASILAFAVELPRRRGSRSIWPAISALVCLCGAPFLPYTNQIFPEVAAGGLLLIFAFHIPGASIFAPLDSAREPGAAVNGRSWVAACALALLPLLHLKFALAAFVGGLGLLWSMYATFNQDARSRRVFILVIGILALGAVASILYTFLAYDALLGPYRGSAASYFADAPRRYAAYLLDADRGLFALTPLLLAVPAGLLVLGRRDIKTAVILVAVILAGHLPNLFHPNWLLGSCPAGRYWIAVLPILILCATIAFDSMFNLRGGKTRKVLMAIFVLFCGFWTLLGGAAFLNDQEAFYGPAPKPFIIADFTSKFLGIPAGLNGETFGWFWSFPGAMPAALPILAGLGIIAYLFFVRAFTGEKK